MARLPLLKLKSDYKPAQAPASSAVSQTETENPWMSHSSADPEADKRSKQIDKELQAEHRARQRMTKVLLLGPSLSGKSTFLRQLRLIHDLPSLDAERPLYRLVIMLSIIDSVRTLLKLFDLDPNTPNALVNPSLRKMRLAPVLGTERVIRQRLGALGQSAGPSSSSFAALADAAVPDTMLAPQSARSTRSLSPSPSDEEPKGILLPARWAKSPSSLFSNRRKRGASNQEIDHADDLMQIMVASKSEILGLWEDAKNRGWIAYEGPWEGTHMNDEQLVGTLDVGSSSKYFLDLLPTLSTEWIPTNDDMLQIRVETVGIEEHVIPVHNHLVLHVCDVKGSRGSRHSWAPFFEDAGAIVFLADASCFNERLVEDPSVNRFADTISLFLAITQNKLLYNVDIILFLNKKDLLEEKCARGVKLSKYHREYDGPEDPESITKYLRAMFKGIFNRRKPIKRNDKAPNHLYVHVTQCTDQRQIQLAIASMTDTILNKQLGSVGVV